MDFKWEEQYDWEDNTVWVANATVGGCHYCYRIKQRLLSNKITYVEHSDLYARINTDISNPETWTKLEDAKYDMWRHYLTILNEKSD